jgi:hypothetical protein
VSSQYFRFVLRAGARRRVSLLEQLIARADAWTPVADWRAEAFRVIAPQAACMPAVAAAALCADRGAVAAAWVCAATPVHYVAEMSNVRLPADGMLSLRAAEAETLASDFNRVWTGSGIRLTAARSAQLFCIFDRALEVVTRDPEDALDRHIEEFLPAGEDAARLKQLISETEMWLFEHEVNRARTESNLPTINGLWFWGGGAPLASLPILPGWAAGDDFFFNAWAVRRDQKFPGGGVEAGGVEAGGDQGGVVVAACAPGSIQWQAVESRWLRPAIDRLRARRISRLLISAADRCFTVTARGLRRFWRRSRPWWESFE